MFFALGGDAGDVGGGLGGLGSCGGFGSFGGATGGGGGFDDLGFFDAVEFADDALIGGALHFVATAREDDFLLDAGHEVADEIVENEGAWEVDHDEKHHDGHNFGHLAGHDGVELGLIGFFAVGGVFHDLAEGAGFLGLFGGELLAGDPVLDEGGGDGEGEEDEGAHGGEARFEVEFDETEEFGVEIVSVLGGVGEIGVLEGDDFADLVDLADGGVGAKAEVVVGGGEDHDTDGGVEGDEDRELDEEGEHGAEGLDVVALVEVHHLEGLELAVAVAVFLDFGELGLDFAHEAGLVELALGEGPEADFDEDGEEDDGEAEVADETVDDKKDVGNRAND